METCLSGAASACLALHMLPKIASDFCFIPYWNCTPNVWFDTYYMTGSYRINRQWVSIKVTCKLTSALSFPDGYLSVTVHYTSKVLIVQVSNFFQRLLTLATADCRVNALQYCSLIHFMQCNLMCFRADNPWDIARAPLCLAELMYILTKLPFFLHVLLLRHAVHPEGALPLRYTFLQSFYGEIYLAFSSHYLKYLQF